jgi:hypothetical protein
MTVDKPFFVRPTYWEDPFPSSDAPELPPPALKALHFHALTQPAADDRHHPAVTSAEYTDELGAKICAECGEANPPTTNFCLNCQTFLDFDDSAGPCPSPNPPSRAFSPAPSPVDPAMRGRAAHKIVAPTERPPTQAASPLPPAPSSAVVPPPAYRRASVERSSPTMGYGEAGYGRLDSPVARAACPCCGSSRAWCW